MFIMSDFQLMFHIKDPIFQSSFLSVQLKCCNYSVYIILLNIVGSTLRDVASSNGDDVDIAIKSARREFKAWRKIAGFDRGNVLKKAANIIRV